MSKSWKKVFVSQVRPIPDHNCSLQPEELPITYRIYQGLFINIRRKLWQWITVDPFNPKSKRCLKSAAGIYGEQMKQLENHFHIIHPFSRFRFIWEMIMIVVMMMLLFCIPIAIAKPDSSLFFLVIKVTLDCICNIDIVLWFFTGYYNTEKQKVELRHSMVAKRYIKTYFIFDFLSSQPFNLYIFLFKDVEKLRLGVSLYLLKIVRVPTLIRYLRHFSERLNVFTSTINLITFFIWFGVILTWTTSITFFGIQRSSGKLAVRRGIEGFPMLMSAYQVTRGLNLVGITEFVNVNNMLMLFEIIIITMGSVFQIFVIAKLMQFYQKRSSSRYRFQNLLDEMGEYMKYKELSLRLKGKILRYVHFKFQNYIFKEESVLKSLSSVLKHDVLMHRCLAMLEKVQLFKDLPYPVIIRIVAKLRSEVCLPSDVIVLAGYPGNAMYFIHIGTVAVYTFNGKEICHLEEGSHFGEIALITNTPRVATVIAVKECELFKLSRRDFQQVVELYPQIHKRIRNLAFSRLESTLLMMEESRDMANQFSSMKDLEEQRRLYTSESTFETHD